jgi:hypothetical protein
MVDDKSNTIVVYDAKQSTKDGSLSPTEFGKPKLKFEDIAYHRPSDTFFVTGAQFKTEKADYRKIFRFRVSKQRTWAVSEVKEVILSREVQCFNPGPPGEKLPAAEGLAAVNDESGATVLWIGLRTDDIGGRIRILEYRSSSLLRDNVHFNFRCVHDVDVSPAQTKSGDRLHLSGLYAAADGNLVVLATTEDKENKYSGNVVYLVNTKLWEQVGAGPEFTIDQKAEGIVLWNNYVGIVYDNDQDTVVHKFNRKGRPSSLEIFPSILPLR